MFKRILFGTDGCVSPVGDAGLLILRVATGLMLAIGHGWGKLPVQPGLVEGVRSMGLPAPHVAAWAAALAEFAGGLLLAVGLLTRPAAFFIAFTMGVAALMVHGGDPLFMTGAGRAKEPALLYLAPALALLLTGPGRFSIDALILPRRAKA